MNNDLGQLIDQTKRLTINLEMLARVRPEGSHPRKTERILTPEGDDVGEFTWALLHSEQNLQDFINFSEDPFIHYREKIPLREIWPMALLHDLEIEVLEREQLEVF